MGGVVAVRYAAVSLVAALTAACGAGTAEVRVRASDSPSPPGATPSATSGDETASFTITTEPAPARPGQEAVITISGRAYGGRHLSWTTFDYGDGRLMSSRQAGCAAGGPPPEPPIANDAYLERETYTWAEPGTYPVTVTLSTQCRPTRDIPPHTVTGQVVVE